MALDNVTSHFSTVLEPITSASSYPVFLLSTICTLGSTQVWQNSRAVQREGPRAHLCRASLIIYIGKDRERARIHLPTLSYQNYKTQTVVINIVSFRIFIYNYFEKGCRKNCARNNPDG